MSTEPNLNEESLLDQVLKNKDNPSPDSLLFPVDDQSHTLPDGSQIYDSTIAAVNRILSLNPHLHKRPTGISSHPYELYNSHTPVDLLNKRTFLSLLKADWAPATPFQAVKCAELVEQYAPVFSRDKLIISDNLLWNRVTGELETYTDEDDIHTVS